MDKELNLWQKIVEIKKVAGGFTKDGQGHGNKYVTGNQILSKIKDKMNELQVLLIPTTELGEHEKFPYTTSQGKQKVDFIVKGKMKYTWINAEKPQEREEIPWAYYGQQDDISKSYGSALTYSERYFILKALNLPTDEDDPEQRTPLNHGPSNTNQGKSNRNGTNTNKKQGNVTEYRCSDCGATISKSVNTFCKDNVGRFKGLSLCQNCQKKYPKK